LDDGFQHRRLRRDLDIVVFDPTEYIRLREPFSALKRAHAILLRQDSTEPLPEKLTGRFLAAHCFSYRVVARGVNSVTLPEASALADWKEEAILAFCGIAKPERFFALLESHGIKTVGAMEFADHHPYSQRDMNRIRTQMDKLGARAAFTTEKDAVRLSSHPDWRDLPLYYVKIALDIDPAFYEYLTSRIGNIPCA
jgi:tetraacyldisaccharide 4'-kinase